MPESYLQRSAAAEAAKKTGYKTFRTVHDPVKDVWRPRYETGDSSPADEWARGKDFVSWTETMWSGAEDGPKRRLGVIIVSITKEELALEDIPADFVVEPQTPELWDESKPARGRSSSSPTGALRAKSDVESPVKLVWRLADQMPGATRAEVIAACVASGVNKSTAGTQFYHWQKAKTT